MIFRADIMALHQQRQPVKADIGREKETNALSKLELGFLNGAFDTYRGIDWIVIFQSRILPETVMSLAKGDTRATPSD
jgi:hypothetical protein